MERRLIADFFSEHFISVSAQFVIDKTAEKYSNVDIEQFETEHALARLGQQLDDKLVRKNLLERRKEKDTIGTIHTLTAIVMRGPKTFGTE
jgi:hypothetical protein